MAIGVGREGGRCFVGFAWCLEGFCFGGSKVGKVCLFMFVDVCCCFVGLMWFDNLFFRRALGQFSSFYCNFCLKSQLNTPTAPACCQLVS